MKRIIGIVVAAVVVAGVAAVYAGDACCGAGQGQASAKSGCEGTFAGLKLSDKQQAKLDALLAECKKTECTETSQKKFMGGVKKILTPEQYAAWQAQCEKAKQSGACPVSRKCKS